MAPRRDSNTSEGMTSRVWSRHGRMTGDSKMQAEGKMDQAEGRIQNTVGGIKDSMRDDHRR